MAIYKSKIIGKKLIAEGTMEFILQKPDGFKYRAGQFFDIKLKKPSEDAKKSSYVHGFSFASAPYEEHLVAATRMRDSAFKNTIRDLPEGTDIELDACFGSFTLPKDPTRPIVYLIGGIGCTPVRSMVAQATHDKTAHKMTLLFANRTPGLAPFVNDFKQWAASNPNFTFVPVYTESTAGEVGVEQGQVDAAMLKRHVPDLKAPVYYLSGPAGMVRAMRSLLMDNQVDEDDIRTEEFDGY